MIPESCIYVSQESNLSAAWARAYLELDSRSHKERAPFMVSISTRENGTLAEDEDLRFALDACLEDRALPSVEKVAKSIFPQSVWQRFRKKPRKEFFDYYLEYLPDFVSMESTKNRDGIYFARLIGYGTSHRNGKPEGHIPAAVLKEGGNQLEFIIKSCHPGAQRMALQVAIYDPVRDQTNARRGFPCLQHLTFAPDFKSKTLAMNAFYATQQLFVKAYGNWLGLSRLGTFVAEQADLRFCQLNCYVGIQKMDGENQPRRGDLCDRLRDLATACAAENTNSRLEAIGAAV